MRHYDRAVTALVTAKDHDEFRAAEVLARRLWNGMTTTQRAIVVRMRAHCLAARAPGQGARRGHK